MRTSLVEITQIEDWILGQGDVENRLITEQKLFADSKFKEQAHWQLKSYDLIHQYGREKLRQEIKAVEHRLFHTSRFTSFQHRIWSIFKR